MADATPYLIIFGLAAVLVFAIIRAGGLARTRKIEVAHQAQLDREAMEYVIAVADQYAAEGRFRPGSQALRAYSEQPPTHTT